MEAANQIPSNLSRLLNATISHQFNLTPGNDVLRLSSVKQKFIFKINYMWVVDLNTEEIYKSIYVYICIYIYIAILLQNIMVLKKKLI